ncbi:MAG TPA: hypothetical protein VGU25_13370 [Acidobacteriaceae bacterium]|nr:hypothetical protein [Acidobacteriaceae bacterium]
MKASRNTGRKFLAACFGSDIYEFSRYLPSYEVADLFLMPTPLHRKVLASQFYKPVYYLPEAIDPIAGTDSQHPPTFPIKQTSRLLWFGYAESFNKGMASLIPVLRLHLAADRITDFSLIVNEAEFKNEFNFPTIPYRNDSFQKEATAFDYCILSHFSLDLALNSYIKSPNKLVTSLMAGLIPIASDTPSYSALLREFRLDRFLFDSPEQLDQILRNLDPANDSQAIIDSGVIETLWQRFSTPQLAKDFLSILSQYNDREAPSFANISPQMISPPRPRNELYFTEHLKDLLPSFKRALRNRTSR